VVLIASGLGNLAWGPFRNLWTVPLCVLAAAAAYAVIFRFYNDHYGRVMPKVGVRGALGIAAAIAVMGGGSVLVQVLDLPLNGILLSWGVAYLGYYGLTVGLRPHHVAIWGAVLVAGLVPLWPDARTSNASNTGLLIVGAAVILTGVLDHRLLVRTLGPSELEHSSAGG
jgi:hypothetical protein